MAVDIISLRHVMKIASLFLGVSLALIATGCHVGFEPVQAGCVSDNECPDGVCVDGTCSSAEDVAFDIPSDETDDEIDVSVSDTAVNIERCGDIFCQPEAVCCDGVCCAPLTEACCENLCTSIGYHPEHCGECGITCAAGEICWGSACMCEAGLGDCDENPDNGCEIALLDNTSHCGACGNTCGVDELANQPDCYAGRCSCGVTNCLRDQECCVIGEGDTTCVDTATSATHCGGCSTVDAVTACAAGEICLGGTCLCNDGPGCGSGSRCCPSGCIVGDTCACGTEICTLNETCCAADLCVELASDDAHCGSCDVACGVAECISGVCVCPSGSQACDGTCPDMLTDPLHCGGCEVACADGETCCMGACADVSTDTAHCGACSLICDGMCADSLCTCPAAMEASNLLTNEHNCGACGYDCTEHPSVKSSPTRCDAGACDYRCNDDWLDCTTALGCETKGATDLENCGACGQECATGSLCVASRCECAGEPGCMESDTNHVEVATCLADGCAITCENGFTDCNKNAEDGCEADLQIDTNNCGVCGNPCPSGTRCNAGECLCGVGTCTTDNGDLCATGVCTCGIGAACVTGTACVAGLCI